MGTFIADGSVSALQVFDENKKPVSIPLFRQKEIMEPIVNLRDWISKFMRTGGQKADSAGNKFTYWAYPKQAETRDLKIEYDDTTGKMTGGYLGAEDSNGMIDGVVKGTFGTKIFKAEITPESAKFLKHFFSKQDVATNGLENIVTFKINDWNNKVKERTLIDLKTAFVATAGSLGTWATKAGFVQPTSGIGLRVKNKDYQASAQGGKDAIDDITNALKYRDKIGLEDGVETTYPFARGLDSSKSTIIIVSSEINDYIKIAIQENVNQNLLGVSFENGTAILKGIAYEGKIVNVEVVNDMPNKNGKKFNWAIIEVGQNGAYAIPNTWEPFVGIFPNYGGLISQDFVLEMIGLKMSLFVLQPELNFWSFSSTNA